MTRLCTLADARNRSTASVSSSFSTGPGRLALGRTMTRAAPALHVKPGVVPPGIERREGSDDIPAVAADLHVGDVLRIDDHDDGSCLKGFRKPKGPSPWTA